MRSLIPGINIIRLEGVRQNNLKGFNLDLPLRKLIVITGPSGSGKSSLAFDTLYSEGQRRYIETFSPYARQFFDRMDKPKLDSIQGVPPAIAIKQLNAIRTSRSTVGTMTEICDYMKNIWPIISQLFCSKCGRPVEREQPQKIYERVRKLAGAGAEVIITFDLLLSKKLSINESLDLIIKQGYQRLLWSGVIRRIEEIYDEIIKLGSEKLTIVQDRINLSAEARSRFIDACEQAYHFGKKRLRLFYSQNPQKPPINIANYKELCFSGILHCPYCDITYTEPTSSLFSYNNPLGACPRCHGFGRIIEIDYNNVIPDKTIPLSKFPIKPWRSQFFSRCMYDLLDCCKYHNVPTDVPFRDLPKEIQEWILNGDPDYQSNSDLDVPRKWYGVRGFFKWMESKAYNVHVRVQLSKYRAYLICPECNGQRLNAQALQYKVKLPDDTRPEQLPEFISLGNFYELPIDAALKVLDLIYDSRKDELPTSVLYAFKEVQLRLKFLIETGLEYLSLNRPMRTLSGGETERVILASSLGSHLVNTLYILDEPTIGLHQRDTQRLIRSIKKLRDLGNTVVVVEHDEDVIRSADTIIDMGPDRGENGGQVVFMGTFNEMIKADSSLTGLYLSGRKIVHVQNKSLLRTKKGPATHEAPTLKLKNVTCHNIKNLNVEIPLNKFVCVTGVSGSGKSTLINDVLYSELNKLLNNTREDSQPSELIELPGAPEEVYSVELSGHEHIESVVMVDQSPPNRSSRSSPITYIGALSDISELYSNVLVNDKKLEKGWFSYNSKLGRCPQCEGLGYEKIEMQFLSDIYAQCARCKGLRYKPEVLDYKLKLSEQVLKYPLGKYPSPIRDHIKSWIQSGLNIAEFLNLTINEACIFLKLFSRMEFKDFAKKRMKSKSRIVLEKLKILKDFGLGYLRCGQPMHSFSGGENQRLKLASIMANSIIKQKRPSTKLNKPQEKTVLLLLDEPTLGLHFDDIQKLINVFSKLVQIGFSLVVIEHNLDVIKNADWIIDLGPEGGINGGKLLYAGPPEKILTVKSSYTGRALAKKFFPRMYPRMATNESANGREYQGKDENGIDQG